MSRLMRMKCSMPLGRNNIMKEKMFSIFAVFIFAALGFACQTNLTSAAKDADNTPVNAVVDNPPAAPADDAPRITLTDAKTAFDAGSALFIDTRAEAAFKQEHVKGAINVPADKLEAKLKELSKDKKIIAYCS